MQRNLERFKRVREEIEVGKMSGAVGTFANIPPEIEAYVCEHLGIRYCTGFYSNITT
jgi:adenylosuccinate lyase